MPMLTQRTRYVNPRSAWTAIRELIYSSTHETEKRSAFSIINAEALSYLSLTTAESPLYFYNSSVL